MARQFEMNWDGDPAFRWRKKHRGICYQVTCKELGLPRSCWTKVDSGGSANQWWRSKIAELEHSKPQSPYQPFVDEINRRIAIANQLGLHDERERLRSELKAILAIPVAELPEFPASIISNHETKNRIEAAKLSGIDIPADADPIILDSMFGDARLWQDRTQRASLIEHEKTIKAAKEKYLQYRLTRVQIGERSAAGFDNVRRLIGMFAEFIGEASHVDSINAELWQNWYLNIAKHVTNKKRGDENGWSASFGRDLLSISRAFVKWLWEQDILKSMPRNLEQSSFKIEIQNPDNIQTFTKNEIKSLLKAATGQLKLHLLLMLNCGHTQQDISDLKKSEIDLEAGTIKRRRSKTKSKKTVPVVTYKLWKTTLKELKKHLSDDPVQALLTQSGKQWVRTTLQDDGKFSKADNIDSNFAHLQKSTNIKKSLKVFRSTAASLIGTNPRYRELRSLFLGHSSKCVADTNYVKSPDEFLAEAIAWLGKELGLA
jgi:integrase